MITNKDAGNTLSEPASGDYDHPPLDEETEFSESEADGNNIEMEMSGGGGGGGGGSMRFYFVI